MLTLVGIGVGKFPLFDASAKTLTWTDPPLTSYDVDRIKLIINTANQSVLYHPDNSNLSITMSDGVITFTGVNNNTNTAAFNDTDRIFVWAQTSLSTGGVDPLSELALTTLQYSAMNDIDISTENLEITSDNTGMEEALADLLEVPDAYVATVVDNYADYIVGQDNTPADGTNIDLASSVNIVNIRSTNDNTKVTVHKDAGGTEPLATDYELGSDRFLDLKNERIRVEQITPGSNETPAEVVIHVVKQ
tara:strand:+ start:5467 stop:6210 length:744 start_codon:yes stop_codon:yes gene_type:complete